MRKCISEIIFICMLFGAVPAYAGYEMNEMPMYNGEHDPAIPENKEASDRAVELGWQYYYKGDYSAAMKRFNQAWMSNRENPGAFWGFGVLMGVRATIEEPEKNLLESIKFLEKANSLKVNDPKIKVDLAYSKMLFGALNKENKKEGFQEYFDAARQLFQEAEKLDNTYPLLYYNWSILEFYDEKFEEAKLKLEVANKLGFNPDPEYERDLNEKLKKKRAE